MEAVVRVGEGIGAGIGLGFVISEGRLSIPRARPAPDQLLAIFALLVLLTGCRRIMDTTIALSFGFEDG